MRLSSILHGPRRPRRRRRIRAARAGDADGSDGRCEHAKPAVVAGHRHGRLQHQARRHHRAAHAHDPDLARRGAAGGRLHRRRRAPARRNRADSRAGPHARWSRGELVLANKVSNFGEKITIVDTLAPGTRAVSPSRSMPSPSVGGFVTPGDFVDILLTRGMNDSGLITDTILRKIRVIAVDQSADEMNDSPALAATVTSRRPPNRARSWRSASGPAR
jgi:hypothetical protein